MALGQACLYFLPGQRERLFDTGATDPNDPYRIRHWRLSNTAGMSLRIAHPNPPPGHIAATKAARLLRPAFPQQELEGKITSVTLSGGDCPGRFDHRDRFAPWTLALLGCFLGERLRPDDPRLRQVRDDRMIVNTVYGLAGQLPDADPTAGDGLERLFSLGLYVDRGSDGFASQGGYAYDRAFVREQLARDGDPRWTGAGTRIGTTAYSQCALGLGDYACGPLARVHVPHIYGRMLLMALFHELTLHHFDRRISRTSRYLANLRPGDDPDPNGRINALHRAFIAFTNHGWQREITSRTQGAELFARQTRALDLDGAYRLV